jgi:CBS domain-containing protein
MTLVNQMLDIARKRLATLSPKAGVRDAAAILSNAGTPLIVVCDDDGVAVGVISRTDVIKRLVGASQGALDTSAESMMTRSVLACQPDEVLQDVWKNMNARLLRCAPILDGNRRPQGVLHARDIARTLLDEATYEELLLRDYVMGVGYQ